MFEEQSAFAASLIASQAHREIMPKDQIFAPFVGSWDLTVPWFDLDGSRVRQMPGEWHFSWVLEGRGVQDVWIVPPRNSRGIGAELYEYGTSIRFFDPAINSWRSTWIGPMHGVTRTFVARKTGEEVVLETTEPTEPRLRWSFSDVTATSFGWRNEVLKDDHWKCQQRFECRRK